MHTFCTYFDSNYIDRGICLWNSLSRFLPDARLFVYCLDEKVFDVLTNFKIEGIIPIRLIDLESYYKELQDAKKNRSRVEYYFTLTPSCVRFIFDVYGEMNEVTYVDSDLLFFSDPTPLFDELDEKNASVGIIEHRFTAALQHLHIHGTYNVGWVTFRRTPPGLACLANWQAKCLEWCYDRVEGERFADQKYLDAWPDDYANILVLHHRGANVALWNLESGAIKSRFGRLRAYDGPLIFYHFHGLSQIGSRAFFTNARAYGIELDLIVQYRIYGLYMSMLRRAQRQLRISDVRPLIRYKYSQEDLAFAKQHRLSGLFLISIGRIGVPWVQTKSGPSAAGSSPLS